MTADAGVLLYIYRDCVFKLRDNVQPPKAGSLVFCRHLAFRAGERVLEIGTGAGLAAVLAARAGCRVVATDIVPDAVECARENAWLNGVGERIDTRLGDGYAPVGGEAFDLICSSPPQMPTPPGRERHDGAAAADNGGVDGWEVLDRIIEGAPAHLLPGGRLVFTLFGFLGLKTAQAKLEAAGLASTVLAREVHAFPRLGYERLDHIRALDAGATLPSGQLPETVERYVLEGALPEGRGA